MTQALAEAQIAGLAHVRREFRTTEFGQMHLRISGSDKSETLPLVCLHMAPQSGQDFESFMMLAGRSRLVIAPDYHGYGESDPIVNEADVTIEAYAKSIWQALDGLGLKKVVLLGHHTGSKVAIEMAVQRPFQVEHVLGIALSLMTPEDYKAKDISFKPLASGFPANEFSDWWIKLQNYYDPEMPFEALAHKYAVSLKVGPRFHLGFKASHEYNARVIEKLKAISVPAAIFNPNDDLREITPKAIQYIETAILLEKPSWRPGFLEINPKDVLESVTAAIDQLNTLSAKTNTQLAS